MASVTKINVNFQIYKAATKSRCEYQLNIRKASFGQINTKMNKLISQIDNSMKMIEYMIECL